MDSFYIDNRNSINSILENNISNSKKILEIGCGDGEFLFSFLNNFNGEYCGVDVNKYNIYKISMLYSNKKNFKFICSDLLNIKRKYYRKFDVIIVHGCIPLLREDAFNFIKSNDPNIRKFNLIVHNNFIYFIEKFLLLRNKEVFFAPNFGDFSGFDYHNISDIKDIKNRIDKIFNYESDGIFNFNILGDNDVIHITSLHKIKFLIRDSILLKLGLIRYDTISE